MAHSSSNNPGLTACLIVRRDLKPDNIFVTDSGTAKVLDFGIAKLLQGSLDEASALAQAMAARAPEPGPH